jgi:hypothetical protein
MADRGGTQMRTLLIAMMFSLISLPVQAANYYDEKWFDYPDPWTEPYLNEECANEACTDIPEFNGLEIEWTEECICTNPIFTWEVLRRDVRVVVSGPDTPDQAVIDAVKGYAAACVTAAIAASLASPQVVAAPAAFYASFKACILALNVAGIAGAIVNQFDIHLDTSNSHWSPL